jgi:hypothetical protein
VRLFTDEALAELARSPHQQVEDAITTGDAERIQSVTVALERSFVGTVEGTRNWISHTFGFAAQHPDPALLQDLVETTTAFFAQSSDPIGPPSNDASAAPLITQLAASAQADRALSRFDSMEDQWRRLQDAYRDWLSMLLSRIYRQRGVGELEAVLRYTAERTLFGWMPTDMARPPEKRLPSWARMLQGHFSSLRIEEDAEKFTLVQDPCGTCTRQIQQGDTPIYRSHVPLWHVTLAGELTGVPWPVNQCPAGLGTGPCRVLLYKDSTNPAAKEQVPR